MSKQPALSWSMFSDVLLARAAALAPVGIPVGTVARAGAALRTAVLATLHVFLPIGLLWRRGLVWWLLPGLDTGDPLVKGLVDAAEIGEGERVEGFDNAVGVHWGLIFVS